MEGERAGPALLDRPSSPEQGNVFEADDEFSNTSLSLTTLDGHAANYFNYLARTRRLEINSPRTARLQEIADRMTFGTGVDVRVIILNKGKESQGFVTGDGSIFITQALINELGSLDELAAVLAHEVGHRINQTHERKGKAGEVDFAVGWVHEIAEDTLAPHLLEKAGFNSRALSLVSMKIAPNQRDLEHQTGEARATQNTLYHGGMHFATSDQELTPMPEEWYTKEATPTNLQIVHQILANNDFDKWARTLPRLHPQDLYTAYRHLAGSNWSGDSKIEQKTMLEMTLSLMSERLKNYGLSDEFINLYFLSFQRSPLYKMSFSMFESPESLTAAIDHLDDFISQKIFEPAQELLFGTAYYSQASILEAVLTNIGNHLCELQKYSDTRGIPVTQDSLLEVLQKIHQLNQQKNLLDDNAESSLMANVVIGYISSAFYTHSWEKGHVIDSAGVYEFFSRIKAAGIPISQDIMTNSFLGELLREPSKQITDIYLQIFPIEEKKITLEGLTEGFLQQFAEEISPTARTRVLGKFLRQSRQIMDQDQLTDSERKVFLDALRNRLAQTVLKIPPLLDEKMNFGLPDEADTAKVAESVYRFNLDLAIAMGIFEQDGEEFYSYVNNAISHYGVDFDQLSWFGLANTSINLLRAPHELPVLLSAESSLDPSLDLYQVVQVNNIRRLLSLPLLQKLINQQPQLTFTSLKELNRYIDSTFERQLRFQEIRKIYHDSLAALILGQHIRNNAQKLFSVGIEETEYDDLTDFVVRCLPYAQEENRILRSIKWHFLRAKTVSLEQKINYVINNFDDIGPEGMIEVAEQITTLSDYQNFHQRFMQKIESYLSGSKRGTQLAVIDVVSSRFVGRFQSLLLTAKTDRESRRKASTDLAKTWFDYFTKTPGIDFDDRSRKIVLGSTQRHAFQTLGDVIDTLENLTPLQRFAIALKTMVDRDGAMTSLENRKLLGETVVSALGVDSSFINQAILHACQLAPADFGSLPAAQILAPLLFRNLDINSVTADFFAEVEQKSNDKVLKAEIRSLMKSSTRDVTTFGVRYFTQPQSYAAVTVSESDRQYHEIMDYLAQLFPASPVEQVEATKSEVNPAYESVITAVENSGPLGTRGLQLARQLIQFSPPIDRRLARSLDRMHGLNKLLFWENVLKLVQDGKAGRLGEGTNATELVDFFEKRLITLDEYLGGGSLYTTYAATVLNDQGEPVNAVVKMLRPNPELFIKAGYQTTSAVFSEIESSGSPKDQKYAKMGQVFIDMSQQWCLKDIQDPSFEEDDDYFRASVSAYNSQKGDVFSVPERLLTDYYVKSEQKAPGRTLNQLLEDPAISPAVKKRAVGLVVDLFRHQLQRAITPSDQEGGDQFHLVQSDPHVGNFIVDTQSDDIRIGIVDRSMFLKLSPQQAQIFDQLFSSGDYRGFVSSLIDQVMDHNNMINETTRATTKKNILSGLTREYISQKLRSLRRFSLEVDNFALLRKMLDSFDQHHLDIPLEMRLMIKNIESIRELQRRYK